MRKQVSTVLALLCNVIFVFLVFNRVFVFLVLLTLLELHIMSNDDRYRLELTAETSPETGALTLIKP